MSTTARTTSIPRVLHQIWLGKGEMPLNQRRWRRRFAEMNPYARARYQTVEQRRDYVEGLARFAELAEDTIGTDFYFCFGHAPSLLQATDVAGRYPIFPWPFPGVKTAETRNSLLRQPNMLRDAARETARRPCRAFPLLTARKDAE